MQEQLKKNDHLHLLHGQMGPDWWSAFIPYTLRCNDIQLVAGQWFSTDQFLNQVKMEFDQLYEESLHKRRMMSVSFHDRIGGSPQMVKATNELFRYIKQHPGVVFRRKDEIARMALSDKNTIRE